MATAAEYDARIRSAITAKDMHKVAAECARDHSITKNDRALLQLRFDLRCRDLFPFAFRRRQPAA